MVCKEKISVIYTGGTIGMIPMDKNSLVPAKLEDFEKFLPSFSDFPVEPVFYEMCRIDSSDMNHAHWIKIAKFIETNYERYSGFVILHGTDTMVYTACALSFLLENPDKPIIITGSYIPIYKKGSDAMRNIIGSFMLAAASYFDMPLVPEVSIFFNNRLFRGNRTRKIRTDGIRCFDSPNYPVLVKMDGSGGITFDKKKIREPSDKKLFIYKNLEKNFFVFDLFPGIDADTLNYVFDIPNLRGVVLRTYGVGNAPTDKKISDTIRRGVEDRNLLIVNVSQCVRGAVDSERYKAGRELLELGIISGADMTPEAALVKMMFLFGQSYDIQTAKKLMQENMRGEMASI